MSERTTWMERCDLALQAVGELLYLIERLKRGHDAEVGVANALDDLAKSLAVLGVPVWTDPDGSSRAPDEEEEEEEDEDEDEDEDEACRITPAEIASIEADHSLDDDDGHPIKYSDINLPF
jgi:hypothetical protein